MGCFLFRLLLENIQLRRRLTRHFGLDLRHCALFHRRHQQTLCREKQMGQMGRQLWMNFLLAWQNQYLQNRLIHQIRLSQQ